MRSRHKIPAVFSIYMVDVLCCALGCVILLWQLYHHDSEEQTAKNIEIRKVNDAISKKNEESRQQIEASRKEIEALLQRLTAASSSAASLLADRDTLKNKLDATTKKQIQVQIDLEDTRKDRDKAVQLALVRKNDYDAMKKTAAAAAALVDVLRLDLKKQEQKSKLTDAELAEKIRAHAGLLDKLAEAEKKLRVLTKDLDLKKVDTTQMAKQVEEKSNLLKLLEKELSVVSLKNKDMASKFTSADLRARILEKDLDRGKKELLDLKRRNADMGILNDDLSKRMTISVKDLNKAMLALAALEQDKVVLIRKSRAAENRFAGVALTGQRVVFLVDMSGSMAMVDENTLEPDKWPTVCDTVAQLMSSLTGLREYQVIVFSDRVKYAFGNNRKWFPYDPDSTPAKVAAGLKKIKPEGGTDMYAAFQEVFKFREMGLDTVYFFSDGLPNLGEGTPANASSLSESQLGVILGKIIRTRLKNDWNRRLPNQPKVRLNCIGFFFDSPDVGAFLWALSREHEGSFVGMSKP